MAAGKVQFPRTKPPVPLVPDLQRWSKVQSSATLPASKPQHRGSVAAAPTSSTTSSIVPRWRPGQGALRRATSCCRFSESGSARKSSSATIASSSATTTLPSIAVQGSALEPSPIRAAGAAVLGTTTALTEPSDRTGGAASDEETQHPASFYCPISRQCMHDPVVLTDGHTYERRYIEQWLKEHHTSPVSGAELESKHTFPNHALRNAIEEYFEKILAGHRLAIQQTVAKLKQRKRRMSNELLDTIDSLMQCSILVNADLSIERVLKSIMDQAKSLVGAQVASVFLVDEQNEELYSTVNSTGGELRIPITSGVAGRVASSGAPIIVHDAYCDKRFNAAVDEKTGFTTRNIMCLPIQHYKLGIIGVAQLINKTSSGILAAVTGGQEEQVTHFTDDDQHFFQVLASQAAVAIVNSGFFDLEHRCSSRRLSSAGAAGASSAASPRSPGRWPSKGGEAPCSDLPSVDRMGRRRSAQACKEPLQASGVVSNAMLVPLLADSVTSWEIDTLTLSEFTGNKPLSTITGHLLKELGLVRYFSLDEAKLSTFLLEIERCYYSDVPYHNSSHAASVVHFTHALLSLAGVAQAVQAAAPAISDPERRRKLVVLAAIIAAAVHDVDHMGLTNDFLVKSFNERALHFSDKHVNEQHHLSTAFKVLHRPECNFLEGLPLAEYRQFRSLVIDLVLATDMAEQGQIMSRVKELISTSGSGKQPEPTADSTEGAAEQQGRCAPVELAPTDPKDAVLLLQLALKSADIGHLALAWNTHVRWVRRLEQEFFAQGDKEKLSSNHESVSFLMDRDKPGVSQTQLGFFNFVAMPMYQTLVDIFPKARPMLAAVEANYQRWQSVEAAAKEGAQAARSS